jgi:pyruvate,water dikinase
MGFDDLYTRGLRASFERCGIMLDTIQAAFVDGFVYTSPRPIGAPPGAATPPKLVLQLLSRLHPALRARARRADDVLRQKAWREDVDDFRGSYTQRMRARLLEAQRVELAALDDAALDRELSALTALSAKDLYEHFRTGGACMLPVGDFLAHAMDWTGCTLPEALALLTGASPESIDAVVALDAAAKAVRDDAEALALLRASSPPATRLQTLQARVPAVATWLELVAERIVTGHDVAELRAIELPGTLIDALRERVERPVAPADETAAVAAATARLRARVPTAHQPAFDELLATAREAHPLRDARSAFDFHVMGLLRRAILEVGRRLTARGLLQAADHAVDCTPAELHALFVGGATTPTAAEVAAHVVRRRSLSCADMPDFLGGTPQPPPPPEWFPKSAARIARAFGVYLDASFREARHAKEQARVTGVGASAGRCRGPARVVQNAADFARVQHGDVLVARITSPAYNVLLPLLAGIVTERGGVLSHPAIVSREYGIPGVVGARGALETITDGVLIEVDGDAGVVRVLA